MLNQENYIVSKGQLFKTLPWNKGRLFVKGITKSGCEVYMPCSKDLEKVVVKELQIWLDNQPQLII